MTLDYEAMAKRDALKAAFAPASIARPKPGHRAFLLSQASDPILAMGCEPMRMAVPNLATATKRKRR